MALSIFLKTSLLVSTFQSICSLSFRLYHEGSTILNSTLVLSSLNNVSNCLIETTPELYNINLHWFEEFLMRQNLLTQRFPNQPNNQFLIILVLLDLQFSPVLTIKGHDSMFSSVQVLNINDFSHLPQLLHVSIEEVNLLLDNDLCFFDNSLEICLVNRTILEALVELI